jgi:hypothetical protein
MAHQEYRTKDGKKVPSVTTILKRFKQSEGLIRWAWQQGKEGLNYEETGQRAADVGTLAHEMIDAFLNGRDPNLKTAEELIADPFLYEEMAMKARKAFGAFKKWHADSSFQLLATETPLTSEAHRYGGCLDGAAIVNGKLTILDWKSSRKVYSDYLVQVAGYAELWRENKGENPEQGVILRVDKETGHWEHYDLTRDELDHAIELFLMYRRAYEKANKVDSVFRKIQKAKKVA